MTSQACDNVHYLTHAQLVQASDWRIEIKYWFYFMAVDQSGDLINANSMLISIRTAPNTNCYDFLYSPNAPSPWCTTIRYNNGIASFSKIKNR